MSSEALAWAFAQPIPPAPKMVLLALANNANKYGQQCFPSLKSIVENCTPMKVRTVQNHLKWLAEQARLITITPWFTESGRQTSNLYELCLTTTYCGEGAESCTPPDPQIEGGEGAESCRGRVQKAAPGRVQKAAPPLNPDLNLDLRKKEESPGGARGTRRRPARVCDTGDVWEAYRLGYVERYRIEPVRDATTNSVLRRLVEKFGVGEAPGIVRQYLLSARKLYIDNGHPPTLLLRDCYGLRTEMKAGPPPVQPVGPKALQPLPVVATQGDPCPPEVAARLARMLGRETFSFPVELEAVGA